MTNPADCLNTRPKSVALIGLGASHVALTEQTCGYGTGVPWEEQWTVNYGGAIFRHDKLWVMDDLRVQTERLPQYGKMLKVHDRPIITSTVYPEFPMSVTFPIRPVLDAIGDDFLNSTVAFAVAYAMTIGVKELWLFGCDFHYPNQTRAEEGGQCCAYLLGLARHFGMTFRIPPNTTLLGAYHAVPVKVAGTEDQVSLMRPLYGYAKQPFIPEEAKNVAGPQERPQDGADPRNNDDAPGLNPSSTGLPAGGRAEHLGAERGDLLRGRDRGDGSPGVVLAASGETDAGAPGVYRTPVTRREEFFEFPAKSVA